tara:strand:- start:197 stop:565 length:369 start_codon:yes stop_codon:yes gene_type:complete
MMRYGSIKRKLVIIDGFYWIGMVIFSIAERPGFITVGLVGFIPLGRVRTVIGFTSITKKVGCGQVSMPTLGTMIPVILNGMKIFQIPMKPVGFSQKLTPRNTNGGMEFRELFFILIFSKILD